jgi:predicted N-acetyltransferase YhbS
MTEDIRLRPAAPADHSVLSKICFDAFGGINRRHGFPPEFPAPEVAEGLLAMVLNSPHVYGVVAEKDGRIVGSNFLWEGDAIAGVGPVTVHPSVQGGSVGRRMMENVLERAKEKGFAGVRLVQAAFNTRSMSLYTKLGFDVREPLVCMQGEPINDARAVSGHTVREATEGDLEACCDLCRRVHGHDRRGELSAAITSGTARVVERGGRVTGYASDVGFFGHVVALDSAGLMALIAGAERISGPGMLLPSRNGEVFRWCLDRELKVVQPMTLMSLGLYNEPRGAFLPSILF